MANYSIKQHNESAPSSGTTVTCIFTSAQTAGDINVVVIGWNDHIRTISSVADTKNGTYTNAAPLVANPTGPSQAIYYFPNIVACASSTNTVTVTFSASSVFPDVVISEFASTNGALWTVDKTAGAATTTSTPTSPSTAATTHANDLVFGAVYTSDAISGYGSGFTGILITTNAGGVEWKEVISTGTQAAGFTGDNSGALSVTQVVAFNAASSAVLLTGTCQAKAVNSGKLSRLLSGTCQVYSVNSGKISRLLSGTCVSTSANTGTLRATKPLAGTAQAKSVNTGVISRFILGTCTVHASNTGVLKSTKLLAGTCLSISVNTGVAKATKPLSGTCTCSSVNTGKISRFISGTCTVHTSSTGGLSSSKLLSGTCSAILVATGKLSRFLSGLCLIHSVNSGSFTVTRMMVGVCIATSNSTGALQSYKILTGSCTVQSVNSATLTSPAYTAVCSVRAVCSGSLSLLYGLYIYSHEFVTVQTMNATQVAHIMPAGAFLALPVNMIPAPAYDWTTQNLEIHGYTVCAVDIRPVWYVTPQTPAQLVQSAYKVYYNNIISKNLVSAFLYADANWGSLTTGNKDVLLQQLVEAVNAILVNMQATMKIMSGTCVASSSSSGVLL